MSRREEDGVAVMIAIGLVAVLVMVGLVGAGAVALIANHRQVQAAADLAALAGAAAAQSEREPCAAAARVAARNGAQLRQCGADGSVFVTVERRLPGLLGGGVVRARARAGQSEDAYSSPKTRIQSVLPPGFSVLSVARNRQVTVPITRVTLTRRAIRFGFSRGTL